MTQLESPKRMLAACGASLVVATLILVIAVLPAEYGLDLLGTGEALGLMELSGEKTSTLQSQDGHWYADSFSFTLAPYESLEYKYRMEKGATMLYSWNAENEVLFEMHSEPDGAAPSFAQTFSTGRSTHKDASYRAPFPGIHGWYWQNRTAQDVTVQLDTAGF
ncbi:MAG: hypothetical protein ACI89U_000576, partial [Gammaproteobacteria bacterium]